MPYTIVPKDAKDLKTKTLHKEHFPEILSLMDYFKKNNPTINDPICLSDKLSGDMKVTRRLSGLDLTKIKKEIGAPKLKLSWGEGSRKVGSAVASLNKGIKFEDDLVRDINLYIKGEAITDTKNSKFIAEFVEHYKLSYVDRVVPMGILNQRRPLQFSGGEVFIGSRNYDIGKTVTDINVDGGQVVGNVLRGVKEVFLSLKFGSTVTIANPGISTLFPEREFKQGKFTSTGAKALLNMLGIDEHKFIQTFESYGSKTKMEKSNEDVISKMNKTAFQNFLKSGIGYGYHMVHLLGPTIRHKEMTRTYMDNATRILSAKVYYGGLSPGPVTAKRVDIVVKTPAYTFKINLRSKAAGKIYPTHVMIDYTYN